jgi:glutathione S-transferase
MNLVSLHEIKAQDFEFRYIDRFNKNNNELESELEKVNPMKTVPTIVD